MSSLAIYDAMNKHDLDEIQILSQRIQQLSNNINKRLNLIENMKDQQLSSTTGSDDIRKKIIRVGRA